MAKMNYDAINFKNKDVDKLTAKFRNGDPLKKVNNTASADKTAYNKPAAIVTKKTNLVDKKQKGFIESAIEYGIEGIAATAKYFATEMNKSINKKKP